MIYTYFGYMQKVTREGDYNTAPTLAAEKIYILIMHENIAMVEAIHWNKYILLWDSNSYVHSLIWAQLLLENSCDLEIRYSIK